MKTRSILSAVQTRGGLAVGDNKALKSIRKLFQAAEFGLVRQGHELLQGLADPEVTSVLVEGVSVGDNGRIVITKEASRRAHLRRLDNQLYVALSVLKASGALDQVKRLDLHDAPTLLEIDALSDLTSLEELDLRECTSLRDISCLGTLTGLKRLHLKGCGKITSFEALAKLKNLGVDVEVDEEGRLCRDGERLPGDDLYPALWSGASWLSKVRTLDLSETTLQLDLTPLSGCSSLEVLNLQKSKVKDLAPLGSVTSLVSVDLEHCDALTDIDGLSASSGLTTVNLVGCRVLAGIQALAGKTALKTLHLDDCSNVQDLSPLRSLVALETLTARDCAGIQDLSPLLDQDRLAHGTVTNAKGQIERDGKVLSGLELLFVIAASTDLGDVRSVQLGSDGHTQPDLTVLTRLPALEEVQVGRSGRWTWYGAQWFTDVTPLCALKGLKKLVISANRLSNIRGLEHLTNLDVLRLQNCKDLSDLSPLKKLTQLRSLGLDGLRALSDLETLKSLSSLKILAVDGSSGVTDLSPLQRLSKLEFLSLENMSSWNQAPMDASPLVKLEHLESLSTSGTELSPKPDRVEISGGTVTGYRRRIARSLKRKKDRTSEQDKLLDYAVKQGLDKTASSKVSKSSRELIAQIRKLLKSKERSSIEQAVELVGSLGMEDVTRVFTEGCGVTETGELSHGVEVTKRVAAANRDWATLLMLDVMGSLGEIEVLDLSTDSHQDVPIADLTRLAKMTALKGLNLSSSYGDSPVADLSPLSGLTNLEWLKLGRCKGVTDLSPLSGLTNLSQLNLSGTGVVDLYPLSGLTSLKRLDLSSTSVTDISPLGTLTQLEQVSLQHTAVQDVSPLANAPNLSSLNLNRCTVSDLSSLRGLQHLTNDMTIKDGRIVRQQGYSVHESWKKMMMLWTGGDELNQIEHLELSGLKTEAEFQLVASLPNLTTLSLSSASGPGLKRLGEATGLETLKVSGSLEDLTAFSLLTGLKELTLHDCSKLKSTVGLTSDMGLRKITVQDCPALTDLSALAKVGSLVSVDLRGPNYSWHSSKIISDLSWVPELKALTHLNLQQTTLKCDLKPLGESGSLQKLSLAACQGITDLSGLTGMASLQKLNLSGCKGLATVSLLPVATLPALEILSLGSSDVAIQPPEGTLTGGSLANYKEKILAVESSPSGTTATTTKKEEELPDLSQMTAKQGMKAVKKLLSAAERSRVLAGISMLDQLTPDSLATLAKGISVSEEGVPHISPDVGSLGHLRRYDHKTLVAVALLRASGHLDNLTHLTLPSASFGTCTDTLPDLRGLKKLRSLSLSGQASIGDLCPISDLKGLQVLDLSGCGHLKSLEGLKSLTGLKELNLTGCSLADLSGIEGLSRLEKLDLTKCDQLVSLAALEGMTSLRSLTVTSRWNLREGEALNTLTGLRDLSIEGSQMTMSLDALVNLERLHIPRAKVSDFDHLTGLTKLVELDVSWTDGSSLQNLLPLAGMTRLKHLNLARNGGIKDLGPLADLTSLESLDLSLTFYEKDKSQLADLGPLSSLKGLKTLNISGLSKVNDLTPLARLKNLETLSLERTGVQDISALAGLKKLMELNLPEDEHPLDPAPLAKMSGMKKNMGEVTFDDDGQPRMEDEHARYSWRRLQHVTGERLASLLWIAPTRFKGAKVLNLRGLNHVSAPVLKAVSTVTSIHLSNCPYLTDLSGLRGLGHLQFLSLAQCTSLTSLNDLDGLKTLETLSLDECTSLSNLTGLQHADGLKAVSLVGCTALKDISALKDLRDLESVDLTGCGDISSMNLSALLSLPALRRVELSKTTVTPRASVVSLQDAALEKYLAKLQRWSDKN